MSRDYEFPSGFLELVRTMPLVEADELLVDRRLDLLRRLHACVDGQERVDLGYVLSAVNDEIYLVRQRMQRIKVGQAVRDCFGDEGFARWRERVVLMELEATP